MTPGKIWKGTTRIRLSTSMWSWEGENTRKEKSSLPLLD
jgi:hypothetical protein